MNLNSHVLIIEFGQILEILFGYLGPRDLGFCFDVCEVWRSEVIRLNNLKVRPVVRITGLTFNSDVTTYLATTNSKHPSFMAKKFCLRDVNLTSPTIAQLLEVNGAAIEELELQYETVQPSSDATDRKSVV